MCFYRVQPLSDPQGRCVRGDGKRGGWKRRETLDGSPNLGETVDVIRGLVEAKILGIEYGATQN